VRRHIATVGLLLAFGAAAGCSSGPEGGPTFDNEGGAELSCLTHQADEPGARYTDREMRNTGAVLALMRYYTANGTKPFCDDAAASESDRAWAQLYVDLGGAAERVSTILG